MSETNPPPLRLHLIRHGEAEGAGGGKLLGFTNPALSKRGLGQVRWLADKLASAPLSAIYSSDLLRARQTADAIAERHSMKVHLDAAWREINMGDWDGRTIAEIYAETPEMVEQLFTDPASFCYPGGESFASFAARVRGVLKQLMTTHKSGEIAVVAHGGVCRAVIGSVLGMPMRNWLRLAQEYGCLNMIEWHEGNPILQRFNFVREAH